MDFAPLPDMARLPMLGTRSREWHSDSFATFCSGILQGRPWRLVRRILRTVRREHPERLLDKLGTEPPPARMSCTLRAWSVRFLQSWWPKKPKAYL